MKLAKKLFAVLLSAALALMVAVPAFAAGTGSITITNATVGTTYTVYKVFDAVGNGTNISYKLVEGKITTPAGFVTDAVGNVIHGTKDEDGVITENKTATLTADEITAIGNYVTASDIVDSKTAAAGDTSVVFSNLANGYYYISTGTGTAVTITSTNPNAVVNDKNETTPTIPDGGKDKLIVIGNNTTTVTTGDIGSTMSFKVPFTAVNYVVKDGEATQITKYTVTDTPSGFSIDETSVAVTVAGTPLPTSDYTASVNADTGVLTVTIDWDDADGKVIYDSPSSVEVTYTATLTGTTGTSTNEAKISYTTADNKETDIPDPTPDEPDTKVYSYTMNIDKQDGQNNSIKLQGAKFVLKNGTGTDAKFYAVDNNGVVSWVDTQTNATEVITDGNGAASFAGLAAGTYYLVETEAPAGYNLLTSAKEVTLDVIDENTTTFNLNQEVDVENNTGATLPTTGGMGTTIFYVLGGVLVVGAGILLVTKKRMNGEA